MTPSEYSHLEPNSTPQTAAEAFWMATQWGETWSHWNLHAQVGEDRGQALANCAAHDTAEAQRMVAIGIGLTIQETVGGTVDKIVNALGGIEDRLSDVRQGMA